jgi:hypothetical protein
METRGGCDVERREPDGRDTGADECEGVGFVEVEVD